MEWGCMKLISHLLFSPHEELKFLLWYWSKFSSNCMVSVEDAPSAPLRGEDTYPQMLFVEG